MVRALIERRLDRNLRLDAGQQVKVHAILLNIHEQLENKYSWAMFRHA